MPTTRSAKAAAGRVQAQALVRFDSTLTELTPAAARNAATTTRSRATKRKVAHPTAEDDLADKDAATPKRARRASASPAKPTAGSATARARRSASASPAKDAEAPQHGILKSPHFELGRASPSPKKSTRPTTFIQPPGDVSPIPSSEPSTPGAAAAPAGGEAGEAAALVPAQLTFSFEDAKAHLVGVDARFAEVFARMKCRPFENLERVDPFRTLVQSILGQQISWMAARSITYKFIRLYNSDMPETRPTDSDWTQHNAFFPTAHQLVGTPIPTLRSAGLSARKAEYVLDLAARFADGRLSTEKLVEADDDELARMLIEVRGIGRWTVDMFAMFSLRRPDILPVGDLGVQRGLLRWFLALHSPAHPFGFEPEKLPKGDAEQAAAAAAKSASKGKAKATRGAKRAPSADPGSAELAQTPAEREPGDGGEDEGDGAGPADAISAAEDARMRGSSPDVSSVPPAPAPSTPTRRLQRKGGGAGDADPAAALGLPALPTPFTASIERTLAGIADEEGELPGVGAGGAVKKGKKKTPLPEGLTVAALKSRLEGKKKIKGAFLTPQEMEALTEGWKPYRSLGVYYMWALADVETKSK